MKLSDRLQEEKRYVEVTLGDSMICRVCRATLQTYVEACSAELSDPCPGFLAIEKVKADFRSESTEGEKRG